VYILVNIENNFVKSEKPPYDCIKRRNLSGSNFTFILSKFQCLTASTPTNAGRRSSATPRNTQEHTRTLKYFCAAKRCSVFRVYFSLLFGYKTLRHYSRRRRHDPKRARLPTFVFDPERVHRGERVPTIPTTPTDA
jgi:hypothetical protein